MDQAAFLWGFLGGFSWGVTRNLVLAGWEARNGYKRAKQEAQFLEQVRTAPQEVAARLGYEWNEELEAKWAAQFGRVRPDTPPAADEEGYQP